MVTAPTRRFLAGVALGLLLATSLRALLSTLFYLSLATLRLNWTAITVLVLLAPALAFAFPRSRWPVALAGVATAALPLARFTPAFVPLAATAAAAGLLALARARSEQALGAFAGLLLAAPLLVAADSIDPLLTMPGALAMLALVPLALVTSPAAMGERTSAASGFAWAALLALELAYLASPFAVAHHVGARAWLVALAGLAGALAGLAVLRGAGRWLWVAGAIGLADVAFVQSPLAVLSLALAQAALAASIARLPRPHGPLLGFVLAPLLFVLLYFGQVLDEREWTLVLPVLSAVVLVAALPASRPSRAPARGAGPVLLVALLTLPFALPAPTVERHEGNDIIIVTWNVHQAFGNRGALDPEIYADVLRDLRPDVVILQEADTARLSSGGVDIAHVLGERLGLHVHVDGTGIAILSRFEAVATREPLGWTSEVGLDVNGTTLFVQGIHLARRPEERAAQAQEILARANATPGPRVVAGDLNSCPAETCFGGRPSDGVYPLLTTVFQDAWSVQHDVEDPAGFTHSASNLRRRIDVVLVRDVTVLDAGPVRDERTLLASDHLPVTARVRVG